MYRLFVYSAFAIAFLSGQVPATAEEARPWEIDDLYRDESFGSVAVASDKSFGVAVRNWIDAETKLQRHSLWFSAGEPLGSRPMEAGEPDTRAPLISPDGKWIAFLSTRPRPKGWKQTPAAPVYSEPTVDIWLISVDGEMAIPLAGPAKPYGRVYPDKNYGRVAFSPDGCKLVFIADDGDDPRTAAEIAANVTVVREDQLFVYGVSYGGYTTSWLVGQTDRFKAAVAENAVIDLTMMWTLSDLQSWTEWSFGGRPWEVPNAMRQHSPLTHAHKVKAPTLILHSANDRRCPLPMGRASHQALMRTGVQTQLVIYPNERHSITQPRHRANKLWRIRDWFERGGQED
jgi:dipeptidyl aminopeptidase/acylaminoacyl peptidase